MTTFFRFLVISGDGEEARILRKAPWHRRSDEYVFKVQITLPNRPVIEPGVVSLVSEPPALPPHVEQVS
ncbi:MAG: hypothetical protein FWC87_00100 [Acidimicrobiaceae bacterium]|nr:hypothetical protein [Acidimicrobiaceae bacterium]